MRPALGSLRIVPAAGKEAEEVEEEEEANEPRKDDTPPLRLPTTVRLFQTLSELGLAGLKNVTTKHSEETRSSY